MGLTTLADVIEAIQDLTGAVTNIRQAPDTPPEQVPAGHVLSICRPETGTFSFADAGDTLSGEHTLQLLVIKPRVNLRTDDALMLPLGDAVARAILADPTLGGLAVLVQKASYTSYGALATDYADQMMYGWVFAVDVLLMGS